jgi:glycosyltransferase involved in cell wall biosynthesis
LESISRIHYPTEDYEVIVVSDGSTDATVSVVKNYPFVRLIDLKENRGRYPARKIGAVINASTEKVIVGRVLGVDKPGPFETFYISIRRKVFPRSFAHRSEIIELNKENFDSLPKGTTVLFVQKDLLFRAYEDLSHIHMGKGSSV